MQNRGVNLYFKGAKMDQYKSALPHLAPLKRADLACFGAKSEPMDFKTDKPTTQKFLILNLLLLFKLLYKQQFHVYNLCKNITVLVSGLQMMD